MDPLTKKLGIAVVIVVIWSLISPQGLENILKSVGPFAVTVGALGLAGILGYQAFDAWRSAFTGQQSNVSAEVVKPNSVGNRSAALFLGAVYVLLVILLLAWIFGRIKLS